MWSDFQNLGYPGLKLTTLPCTLDKPVFRHLVSELAVSQHQTIDSVMITIL